MRTLYTLTFLLGLTAAAQAQIVEKPLKLEGQAENDKNSGAIVFPPATEPYQPTQTQPKSEQAYQEPAYQQPRAQQVYQQPSYQQPVAQPAYQQPIPQPAPQPTYNSAPSANYGGAFASRDTLENAANNCEAELGQLWQQKNSVDVSRRAQFQKSMGEAKKRCDQLKESAKALKQADYSLYTYQNSLQEARGTMY